MPDREKNKKKSSYKPTIVKSSEEDNYFTDDEHNKNILNHLMSQGDLNNLKPYNNTKFSKGKDSRGEYIAAYDPSRYKNSLMNVLTGNRNEYYNRYYLDQLDRNAPDKGSKYPLTNSLGKTYTNRKIDMNNRETKANTLKLSNKEIPLTQGRYNTGKVNTAVLDEVIKASKKKKSDPNDLLALMGRETTLGNTSFGTTGKKAKKTKTTNMKELVSGWDIYNDIEPYMFNRYLADKKIEGVKVDGAKGFGYKDFYITDSAKVEKALKANPKLGKEYKDKLDKTPLLTQNAFEQAIDYVNKYGIAKYNPGDPDYKNKIAKDKKLIQKEKGLQDYIKTAKKKFAYGGVAINYDTPQQALFKMIRNTEEAGHEASSDPLVAGLKGLGGMMISTGMSMAGSGFSGAGDMDGISGFFQDNFGDISKGISGATAMTNFAKGGQVGPEDIEVEGNEMFETPQGQVGEFDGPSHEEGGIPLKVKSRGVAKDGEVPAGTYIYPDSIKINGKSLADRKKMREKKERKITDLLSDSSDRILKNTLNRVKQMNIIEDSIDRTIQANVKRSKTGEKYADGGGIPPLVQFDAPPAYSGTSPKSILDILKTFELNGVGTDDDFRYMGQPSPSGTTPTQTTGRGSFDMSGLPTVGDALGMFGNLFQAYKPLSLTKENRAGDTPNINPYDNYGNDALKTLEGNKALAGNIMDTQLNRNRLGRKAAFNRNNNSARGVNTQRALNLATDAQYGQLDADLFAKYAEQLMGINNQIASTQLDISGKKSQGEQYRDQADRQDRDAYYTNLGKDYQSVGEAWSRTGKSINQIKDRSVQSNFLNQMFDYVQGNLMNGTISQKEGVSSAVGRNANEAISDFKKTDTYKKMSKEQKEQFNNTDALSILSMLGLFK